MMFMKAMLIRSSVILCSPALSLAHVQVPPCSSVNQFIYVVVSDIAICSVGLNVAEATRVHIPLTYISLMSHTFSALLAIKWHEK